MTTLATEEPRPVLTFEDEPHIYRVDGRIVPSVTGVIRDVYGDLVWPWRSEFALERGKRVHEAMHLWILGDLDAKRLSPYIAGFVAGGIRFLTETGFEIRVSEHRMYSSIYDVAGTTDLIGIMERKLLTCADFKTGEPGWATGPQTAMYSQQWQEETGEVIRKRIGVQLHEDGTYTIVPYKNFRDDIDDFAAARRVLARRAMLEPEKRRAA